VLLVNVLPELAREVEQLLKNQGKFDLAAQVLELVIVDRCRCGDSFCASFYTQPKPRAAYGPNHDSFDLDASEGMLLLDVVSGKIVHVEVLNRDDVRRKLVAALP
jgi:hypothetical protein